MTRCAMCFGKPSFGSRTVRVKDCILTRVNDVQAIAVKKSFLLCKNCYKAWKKGNPVNIILEGKEYEARK